MGHTIYMGVYIVLVLFAVQVRIFLIFTEFSFYTYIRRTEITKDRARVKFMPLKYITINDK